MNFYIKHSFFYTIGIISLLSCQTKPDKIPAKVYNGEALIIYSSNGKLISYNIKDSTVNWTYDNQKDVESRKNQFTIENDIIYIPFAKGSVSALNARSGEVKWSHQLFPASDFKNLKETDLQTSYLITGQQAVIHKDKVFIAGRNAKLYALDKKTGKQIWEAKLNSSFTNYPPLFIADDLYISNGVHLYKFNPATGQQLWDKMIEKEHAINALTVTDQERLYTADGLEKVYAYNTDGKLQWEFKVPHSFGFPNDQLIINKGVLYFTASNQKPHASRIFALDTKTGKKLWETTLKDESLIYQQYLNDVLYGYSLNSFYIFDPKNGKKVIDTRLGLFSGYEEAPVSNIVNWTEGNVFYHGLNGIINYNPFNQVFSMDSKIRAPHEASERVNPTWMAFLPAK